MILKQQTDGEKAVDGQQQPRCQRQPRRYGVEPWPQQGVDIAGGHGRQRPPDQGKGQAHPAVQVHFGGGVVPEHDSQQPVAAEVDGVLHGGGGKPAIEGQVPEGVRHIRRQSQHRQHGKAVHRTYRQQQIPLADGVAGTGDKGIDLLQQIAKKAVGQKAPEVHGQRLLSGDSVSRRRVGIPTCQSHFFLLC